MRRERHREAEVKAGGVPYRRIARGEIGVHRVRRLHECEGRDDDAPYALDRVEGKNPTVPFHDPAHHLGFARGPERSAGFLRALDLDQLSDDFAALDQMRMHRRIDAVDLRAQIGERGRSPRNWLRLLGIGHGNGPTQAALDSAP